MKRFVKIFVRASSLLLILTVLRPAIFASVDDAQSFALQAAEPYVKQGFQVREDYWGGDLGSGEKKAVRQQLFKGNEYWFWLGTEVDKAKVSVHVYDSDGKLFYHRERGTIARGTDALGAGLWFPLALEFVAAACHDYD